MPSALLEEHPARLRQIAAEPHVAGAEDGLSPHGYRTLLATLAHDLKNPLTRIRARAQLLQRRLRRPEALDRDQFAEGLAQIEGATVRMAMLLDELVELSATNGHPLPLVRRPVDLLRTARHLAELYQQTTDRHHVRVESPAREVVGLWDPLRVERVISNLLSNAVKYSPDGGDVVIGVWDEMDREDGRRWAVLRVRDQGVGIPAEDLPHTFEELHRGGNVIGRVAGTGLGLAGVLHMVAEHGGTVSVESDEGRGSTFTVRLPLDSSSTPAGAAS